MSASSHRATSIAPAAAAVACLGIVTCRRHKRLVSGRLAAQARTEIMTSEMFRIVSTCVAALFVGTLLVTALLSAPVLP